MKRGTRPPSLTGAVDTVPLVSTFVQTTVRTSVIRAFWRGDRFISTHVEGGRTSVVEVDLEGRATTLATLPGRWCYFLHSAGPHVIAGVQWGMRSDETEVWLVPFDRSAPRLLMHGDPDVATPEVMLPPVTSADGAVIALRVYSYERRSRVRIFDDRGTTLEELEASPERWDGDDLVVSEYDEATETVRLRAWNPRSRVLTGAAEGEQPAPYLLDETTRGSYEISNTSTGQVVELAPTRKRERDLQIRYRKHGARLLDSRFMVLQLGDSFLVDCETGRSWTILPGVKKLFLDHDLSVLAVVADSGALLLARLDQRWRTGAPPAVSIDCEKLIDALAGV